MEYRLEELDIKADMERKFRSFKLDLGRLQNLLPPVKIPKILKESYEPNEVETKTNQPKKVVKEVPSGPEDDLEKQLKEIQKRLGSIKG